MNDAGISPPLSAAQSRRIDQICDQFEEHWLAGRRPAIDDSLGTLAEPERSALLRQLLLLDWVYRRRSGEEPTAADYQPHFLEHIELIESVGREMAECCDSTWVGSVISHDAHTTRDDSSAHGSFDDAELEPPTGLARYDLIHEVGHGGIGVVYRSHDKIMRRELAIKVLRESYCDQSDARRRFFEEARVGSQLQHPAIVPVYELGWLDDRRPYFTMKLVEGHTLAKLLEDRSDNDDNLSRLMAVFDQVCQAMAYAHTRGVVHRDLKPNNIMVGAFGEVQVMDWGFAKVLTSPSEDDAANCSGTPLVNGRHYGSQSGALMGTPAYMPPEQARGESILIDARADVFAIGAILCEILTGRPPYSGRSAEDICGQAAAGDLAEAHARLDNSSADHALCHLAKRCLSADRDGRPLDAGVVATEMTVYLAASQERLHQAQLQQTAAEMRAESAFAKIKAERRVRRLTIALAAALLVGTGIATWQAVVATRAKETANAKEADTRAVLDFVQKHVFAAARPAGQDGGLGRDVPLRTALQAALPAVEKSFASQPLVEAQLCRTLGDSLMYLGEAKTAADQYRRARAIDTEQLGFDHPDTLQCSHDLANALAELGQADDALTLREETLALRKVRLGPGHRDTLMSFNNLANSYYSVGRYDQAFKMHEEALAIRKAKFGADHPDTLSSMFNLGGVYAARGRYTAALKLYKEIAAIQTTTLGPDHPDTLESTTNLATSYGACGRLADALAIHEDTLARRKSRLGADHPQTLWSMYNVAVCFAALDRHADAVKLFEETLALQKIKLGLDHRRTLYCMYNLAFSLTALDRDDDALKLHEETLALRRAKLGPNHRDTMASIEGVMDCQVRKCAKANDVDGCRAVAEQWEVLQRTDHRSLYAAACYRAITAKVIRTTDQSPEGAKVADAEADRAMGWLKKSVAAGYKDAAKIETDKDLDFLRDRADFTKLMASMNAGSQEHQRDR
jgi:eukaryotic-like serine/threonine-protein kinase